MGGRLICPISFRFYKGPAREAAISGDNERDLSDMMVKVADFG